MNTSEDLIYARLSGIPVFCIDRKYYVHDNPIARHYIITIFSKLDNKEIVIDIRKINSPIKIGLTLSGAKEYLRSSNDFKSSAYEVFNLDINARDYLRKFCKQLYGNEEHINYILNGIEKGFNNDTIL